MCHLKNPSENKLSQKIERNRMQKPERVLSVEIEQGGKLNRMSTEQISKKHVLILITGNVNKSNNLHHNKLKRLEKWCIFSSENWLLLMVGGYCSALVSEFSIINNNNMFS